MNLTNAPAVAPARSQGGTRSAIPKSTPTAPFLSPSERVERAPTRPSESPGSFPGTLRFLKDSIREVAFANYFLNAYERELKELSPAGLSSSSEPSGPETPAQRAERLLEIHLQLEARIETDLSRIVPALESLAATGLAALEESVFHTRNVLAAEVIVPNLSVLKLEQDGGVQSPFRDLDAEGIIELLLKDSEHEEARMHQAERLLRGCSAVQSLHRDRRRLATLMAEPDSQAALDGASRALEESARVWNLEDPVPTQAGPFTHHQKKLSLLQSDLNRRAARLAWLGPRFESFATVHGGVLERIRSDLPTILGDVLPERVNCASHYGTSRIAPYFGRGTILGRLAEAQGLLPVAQAFREVVAGTIDAGGDLPDLRSGPRTLPWAEVPSEVSLFIREQVQALILKDAPFKELLNRHALNLCNRRVAEELERIVSQFAAIPDPEQHTLLTPPEAAGNIQEAISRIETAARTPAGRQEGASIRNPVVALLGELTEQIRKEEALVDSVELEGLFDAAFDYVRRRAAFQEQVSKRATYVQRGWTTGSRQKRMEKTLHGDLPTTSELGAIDAELSESFDALQTDAETFLDNADCPVTKTLTALVTMERVVKETARSASPGVRAPLEDPGQSAVFVGLLKVLERARRIDSDAAGRLQTIEALAGELRRVARLAPALRTGTETESALGLCRTAELSPVELAGFSLGANQLLPLAQYLDRDTWGLPASLPGPGGVPA